MADHLHYPLTSRTLHLCVDMQAALLDLLPALAKLCPPAAVLDKTFYSAFSDPQLLQLLQVADAATVIERWEQ